MECGGHSAKQEGDSVNQKSEEKGQVDDSGCMKQEIEEFV